MSEEIDTTSKIKALSLLAGHLHRYVRDMPISSWKGVANGDHIVIFEGNLYRVDLNAQKVAKT